MSYHRLIILASVLGVPCIFMGCAADGGHVWPSAVATSVAQATLMPMTPSPVVSATAVATPKIVATSSPSAPIVFVTEKAQQSDAFVDSIGVNVHLTYANTAYVSQYDEFKQLLLASGIRHVRDSLMDSTTASYYDHLNDLGANGVHATLFTALGQSGQLIQQFPSRVPGVVEAIEAPNELDLNGGATWVQETQAFQPMLYAAVKSTSSLPVIGPSLTSAQAYAAVGNLSSYMDYANMHNYFGSANPGAPLPGSAGLSNADGEILADIQSAAQVGGSKPIVSTENGYCTVLNSLGAVSLPVQAKYVPRMFLEQWRSGVKRTIEYEFLDEAAGCNGSYGLVASTGALAPKPAYYAVSGLIATLRDPGGAFSPGALSYQLFTTGANINHILFQKRSGIFELVVWQEVSSWDTNGDFPIAITPQTVTLTMAANPSSSSLTTFADSGVASTQPLTWMNGQAQLQVTDSISIVGIKQ